MRSPKTVVTRVLLALGAVALTLVAIEAGLRALGLGTPVRPVPLRLPGQGDLAEPFTQLDELLLYRGVPNARTYPIYTIDGHGWRTPPFAEAKPAGTFRIIVTGDSTTFGLGVVADEPWPALLRRALAVLCDGDEATEVIDAAFIGYSTLQNRMQVEHELLPLDPDLVVVLVSGANDATPVLGRGDAELVASQGTLMRRISRSHLGTLLGLGESGWAVLPMQAPSGSGQGRLRVTPDEAGENVRAMAELLSGRLMLGIFVPSQTFPEGAAVAQIVRRVTDVAAQRGVPVADVRPVVEAFSPYPLYNDNVHPVPLGHALIARTVLRQVLTRVPLSPARRAWCEAWQAACEGDVAGRAETLCGAGAPPGFRELLAVYRGGDIGGRLAAADASLPEVVREWDPLEGTRCRARSSARLLLAGGSAERLAELASFARPADPLVACFPDEAAFLAADGATRDLARALVVFSAVMGLPALRVDTRLGAADLLADRGAAAELLRAALELDPSDPEARLRLGLCLRSLNRRDEFLAEFARLAVGEGPLADFGRGVVAFDDGDLAAAEPALRNAVARAPALGFAHVLLGQILFRQDRLDEAVKEFGLAAVLVGSQAGLPQLLERIEVRRRELADAGR